MTTPRRRESGVDQRGPLEKALVPACIAIFVLGFVTRTLGRGETVTVSTNVPGANVSIDERDQAEVGVQGRFEHIPRGVRHVTAAHRDYVRANQYIDVGLFGSHDYQVTMVPLMIHFRASTVPQAEVLLNGKPIGTADDNGVLEADAASGEYSVEARLAGYEGGPLRVEIRGSPQFYVPLQMTEAKRQELASRQERANELVQQARTLFSQRNYSGALKAAEDAVKLAPRDVGARQLRDQIAETIRILQQ